MTTSKEQEAFGLVLERQKSSASENDIRTAFQRFMETAGVAAASEMTTERPPGVGNPGRMDLYVHNTCIEFKTNILRGGAPDQEYVAQLDGYLKNLLKAGSGVRNGILTDGVHYFLRRVGEEELPLQKNETRSIFDRAEQAPRLREYLHSIIWVPSENISPTAENLERHFGNNSDAFLAGNLLLKEAYEAHRDDPTVAVKRRLWQDLLQVALGKDAATAGDESDWLFIRHTYITSLVAVIMQQQLLGDVAHYASAEAGRPAQGTHPSRTIRPARCHRRRPVHLAYGGGGKHVPTRNSSRRGMVRLDAKRERGSTHALPERDHAGRTQAPR